MIQVLCSWSFLKSIQNFFSKILFLNHALTCHKGEKTKEEVTNKGEHREVWDC